MANFGGSGLSSLPRAGQEVQVLSAGGRERIVLRAPSPPVHTSGQPQDFTFDWQVPWSGSPPLYTLPHFKKRPGLGSCCSSGLLSLTVGSGGRGQQPHPTIAEVALRHRALFTLKKPRGTCPHWQQLHFSASALAPSPPLHTQSLAHFSHSAGQQEQQPADKMGVPL